MKRVEASGRPQLCLIFILSVSALALGWTHRVLRVHPGPVRDLSGDPGREVAM